MVKLCGGLALLDGAVGAAGAWHKRVLLHPTCLPASAAPASPEGLCAWAGCPAVLCDHCHNGKHHHSHHASDKQEAEEQAVALRPVRVLAKLVHAMPKVALLFIVVRHHPGRRRALAASACGAG